MRKVIAGIVSLLIIAGYLLYQNGDVKDWIWVNFLTVSTKEKQKRNLELAHAYAHNLTPVGNLYRYEKYLRTAEDMAEKLIFLDGQEVGLGYEFEEFTRDLEPELLGKLEAQSEARIQNRKMFEYLVKNYQFTDADIERHKEILEQHIGMVEGGLKLVKDQNNAKKIEQYLTEARKFQKAGLNVEAYGWIERAKNVLYTSVIARP